MSENELVAPLDAIVFDCDGTLCAIEGIDVLADQNGVGAAVADLTAQAMGQSGVSPALYAARLNLVSPTAEQVHALAVSYQEALTPGVAEVIAIFQRMGKAVYIVSAGLFQAIVPLAEELSIASEHVFAVSAYFDAAGQYAGFDEGSCLVRAQGKIKAIEAIKATHPRILHVGDGLNDLDVKAHVTRFVGYGGCFYRPAIESVCTHYIKTPSLLPLLPLALTGAEREGLSTADRARYDQGRALSDEGAQGAI